MPLAEFEAPAITNHYLKQLDKEQLLELLQHKTRGLLVASKLSMGNTISALKIGEEVKKIQTEIESRNRI